jgi:hypothetical protein
VLFTLQQQMTEKHKGRSDTDHAQSAHSHTHCKSYPPDDLLAPLRVNIYAPARCSISPLVFTAYNIRPHTYLKPSIRKHHPTV